MSCASLAKHLPTRSGHSMQIWGALLEHSHFRWWRIGGRDSRQSRMWRKRRRIDCEVLVFHPQQDFDHRGGRLLLGTAFGMKICRVERRLRRRMSLDRESWKPGWPVQESRAHAVEGLSRAATWYSFFSCYCMCILFGRGEERFVRLT